MWHYPHKQYRVRLKMDRKTLKGEEKGKEATPVPTKQPKAEKVIYEADKMPMP